MELGDEVPATGGRPEAPRGRALEGLRDRLALKSAGSGAADVACAFFGPVSVASTATAWWR